MITVGLKELQHNFYKHKVYMQIETDGHFEAGGRFFKHIAYQGWEKFTLCLYKKVCFNKKLNVWEG